MKDLKDLVIPDLVDSRVSLTFQIINENGDIYFKVVNSSTGTLFYAKCRIQEIQEFINVWPDYFKLREEGKMPHQIDTELEADSE